MAETKSCTACNREIPQAADTCGYCGTAQSVARLRPTAMMMALQPDDAMAAGGEAVARKRPAHPSQTEDTLLHLETAANDVRHPAHGDQVAKEVALAAVAEPGPAEVEVTVAQGAARGVGGVSRVVMVVAGLVLLGVFESTRSLLGVFGGNRLILATYYLVGGLLFVIGGVLPLPERVRAAVATIAGAVPLFVAPPLVELDGWRGLAAAFVVLLLPGALLLRSRITRSWIARGLVAMAVAVTALIYLVPAQGVTPLTVALKLLATGSIDQMIAGGITVAPLGLAAATLTVFAPSSSTGLGRLWAALVLLSISGAVVLAGLLGAATDLSLVQLGVSLLAAGGATAMGVSQLLDLDGQTA